jgi:hypothetical protein
MNDNGPRTEYGVVRLPKVILSRVEAIFAKQGYTSVTDYIRAATLKQLASDEGRT